MKMESERRKRKKVKGKSERKKRKKNKSAKEKGTNAPGLVASPGGCRSFFVPFSMIQPLATASISFRRFSWFTLVALAS